MMLEMTSSKCKLHSPGYPICKALLGPPLHSRQSSTIDIHNSYCIRDMNNWKVCVDTSVTEVHSAASGSR